MSEHDSSSPNNPSLSSRHHHPYVLARQHPNDRLRMTSQHQTLAIPTHNDHHAQHKGHSNTTLLYLQRWRTMQTRSPPLPQRLLHLHLPYLTYVPTAQTHRLKPPTPKFQDAKNPSQRVGCWSWSWGSGGDLAENIP